MLIAKRNLYRSGLRPPWLPDDCVLVEYLKSTGTQFINLGFGFDPTDEVEAVFSIEASQVLDKYIVSPSLWNNDSNRYAMGVHTHGSFGVEGAYCVAYGENGTGMTGMYPYEKNDGLVHKWSYKNNVFSLVDVGLNRDCSLIRFGSTTANLKLFYGYNTNTKGRLSSYKHIKANGVGIDLVAVRNEIDGRGYMCDKLTGDLYGNDGAGEFIIGPDKASNGGGINV